VFSVTVREIYYVRENAGTKCEITEEQSVIAIVSLKAARVNM